jgi:heptosyltransferase I
VIAYRRRDGVAGVRSLARDLAASRRARGPFDLALNLNVYFKSVWPLALSRAPGA